MHHIDELPTRMRTEAAPVHGPAAPLLKVLAYTTLLFILLSCSTAVKVTEKKLHYLRHRKQSVYPLHRNIRTTYFYVGQHERSGGHLLDNRSSAWTGDWVGSFGGVDFPHRREGYHPRGFVPRENPFYCALPYNDIVPEGRREHACSLIPWAALTGTPAVDDAGGTVSLCKNRWVRIVFKGRVAYAQWEDVGPFVTDDAAYVFGGADPRNRSNGGAGLDVSPAVRDYLGMENSGYTDWQFVEAEAVPPGPWLDIVSTSDPCWD